MSEPKRTTKLDDLLHRAHHHNTEREKERHAAAMINITERFEELLAGSRKDGLTTCPICWGKMTHHKDKIFLRLICDGLSRHSWEMRL